MRIYIVHFEKKRKRKSKECKREQKNPRHWDRDKEQNSKTTEWTHTEIWGVKLNEITRKIKKITRRNTTEPNQKEASFIFYGFLTCTAKWNEKNKKRKRMKGKPEIGKS